MMADYNAVLIWSTMSIFCRISEKNDTITFLSTGTILGISDTEIQVRDLQTGSTSIISTDKLVAGISKNTPSSSTSFREAQFHAQGDPHGYPHAQVHSQAYPQAQDYVQQQFQSQPQQQHRTIAKTEKASQKSYDTLSALLGSQVIPLDRMETFVPGSDRMETFDLGREQPRRVPENYNI